MLEVSNISVVGWEPTIRGMRNPMNSWERSDSVFTDGEYNRIMDRLNKLYFSGDEKKE